MNHAQAVGHTAATLGVAVAWYSDVDFGVALALWSLLHGTVYLVLEAATATGVACSGYVFMGAAVAMVLVPDHALLLCAIASVAEWRRLSRQKRAVLQSAT